MAPAIFLSMYTGDNLVELTNDSIEVMSNSGELVNNTVELVSNSIELVNHSEELAGHSAEVVSDSNSILTISVYLGLRSLKQSFLNNTRIIGIDFRCPAWMPGRHGDGVKRFSKPFIY
jgi:hypothetical protein